MLPGLDLPPEFTLFRENLVMPYGGAKHLRNTAKLFELPVCKMLSRSIPVLWFLGNHCRIDVVGTADVGLVVNGPGEGFNSKGALEIRTMTNGVATQTTLPAQGLHFASAAPLTTSFAIPYNAVAGSQVTYRLRRNSYTARVSKIELGVGLEFYVLGIKVGPTVDLGGVLGRLDLLEGTTLNVNATAPEVFAHLGYMTTNSAPSCSSSSGTPKLRPTFSGVLPTLHRTETQHWFIGVFNDGNGPPSGQYSVTVTIPASNTGAQVAVESNWNRTQSGTGQRTFTCTRSLPIAANAAGTGFTITAKQAQGAPAAPEPRRLCGVRRAGAVQPVHRGR